MTSASPSNPARGQIAASTPARPAWWLRLSRWWAEFSLQTKLLAVEAYRWAMRRLDAKASP